MTDELRRLDEPLAARHGAYPSYLPEDGPASVEYHGQPPGGLVDRLLDLYARSDGCFLDAGCGAGHTLCRLAPRVREAWGIELLVRPARAAGLRAEAAGLTNVTVIRGDTTKLADVERLPDGRFALALSRRGPNFTEALVRKLAPGAYVVQELVAGADCAGLREFLGRRAYEAYPEMGHEALLRGYQRLGLLPVSSTEFFYEAFFRDVDHLEAHLRRTPANLSDWRLGPKPYVPERDRAALALYARYNGTAGGIRLLHHRWVLALRLADRPRYPVDAVSAAGTAVEAVEAGTALPAPPPEA